MQPQLKENYAVTLLGDRRTNPFIRTRNRSNFDRRNSYRVGAKAVAFFDTGDEIIAGTLCNISDSGACVALPDMEKPDFNIFQLGIPSLNRKKITCEKSWFEPVDSDESQRIFGVKFVDLDQEEKNTLRKRFLLEESLFLSYAQEMIKKTDDPLCRQEINAFFLIDLRMAINSLIDIDTMVATGENRDTVWTNCKETLDSLVDAGDKLETSLGNTALSNKIKQRVRCLLGHFIYQSTIFRRSFEKPRGYPGDYQTLELVYDNKDISSGLGKYLDRYGLNVPYSQAIRHRKDKMKEILYDFINTSTEEKLNIINLASGACRDIREMFDLPLHYKGNVTISCIDQDEVAIKYSENKLAEIDTGNVGIRLTRGNILKLDELDIGEDNSFDMVYSIGIVDYLNDLLLKKVLNNSFKKLKPGGKLVLAYKDSDAHRPVELNWYADWNFVPRNENEFLQLIKNTIGEEKISIAVERENSGIIFFAVVTKK